MSQKRKVEFAEDEEHEFKRPQPVARPVQRRDENISSDSTAGDAKGKHSLDSDEEDNVETSETLRLDDIEGIEKHANTIYSI
jgi:hypothetical protein